MNGINSEPISMSALSYLCDEFKKNNSIKPEKYAKYHVKRGLRNDDGSGVMAGLTLICNVHGYVIDDGEKIAQEGKLYYRGIEINEIINGAKADGHFAFEEVAWLLLFGTLPNRETLAEFRQILSECRELPENFKEDMILKAPSQNIMNKMARSVLALYSYDYNPDNTSMENVMRQSIKLLAQLPTVMVNAYQVKRGHFDRETMFFHPINPAHSTAEFILSAIRPDRQFTPEEAKLLDLCLVLHAEHGGGNNSTFATRVVSSSGTDTYSAIAAAIGSLKGPKHGGANIKVTDQLRNMLAAIDDETDDNEILEYLEKVVRKEEGDKSGLIYGMGHAVYTKSDPRAQILKENLKPLAEEKGMLREFTLLDAIERLAPQALVNVKGTSKDVCANVDLYSGLVYHILGIPPELFTPLFAVARIAGWSAHRVEESYSGGRIIRPAYKSVVHTNPYVPIDKRN